MSHRPDLDADALWLRNHVTDPWDVLQLLSMLNDKAARQIILGRFTAAFLHAAVQADIDGLKERNARGVPACYFRQATLEVHSADRTRKVLCTHWPEQGYIEIVYCIQDQERSLPQTTRQSPAKDVTDDQLPGEVRRNADEIRAFLLRGQLPAGPRG